MTELYQFHTNFIMFRFSIFVFFATAVVSFAEPLPPLPTVPADLKSPGFPTESGWFFLPSELKHLMSAESPESLSGEKNPIPAIKAFHEALAVKGIRLYVLPVPEKSLVRVDQLVAADQVEAARGYSEVTDRFVKALKESGVSVIETRELLVGAALKAGAEGDPVYCRTDSHYTPATCELMAKTILAQLKADLPGLTGPAGAVSPVAGETTKISIQGDLAPDGNTETLAFTPIQASGDSKSPPVVDPASPVLLLGDSHCLVFHAGGDMLAAGGGLPDQLGVALGFMPDVIAVRGSGATSARINLYRKARKDAAYLAGKKVVVWCFAARDFTQADAWKVVPMP